MQYLIALEHETDIAGLDELALERLQAAHRNLSAEELSLVEEALDLLSALLLSVNVRTGFYSISDDRGCLERLRSACG